MVFCALKAGCVQAARLLLPALPHGAPHHTRLQVILQETQRSQLLSQQQLEVKQTDGRSDGWNDGRGDGRSYPPV